MLCHPEPHPMVSYALRNAKSPFATLAAPEVGEQHTNIGTVTADVPPSADDPERPTTVTDEDPANAYVPDGPALSIQKRINGLDTTAETPAGVATNGNMLVTFIVRNTGTEVVNDVAVVDNVVPAASIEAPADKYNSAGELVGVFTGSLEPGEYAVFSATIATPSSDGGTHTNTAVATGITEDGTEVESPSDEAFAATPKVDIVKKINGRDANTEQDAVRVTPGARMKVTYEVTNNGKLPLENLQITDVVYDPKTNRELSRVPVDFIEVAADQNFSGVLQPGATVVFQTFITAPQQENALHYNVASVSGTVPVVDPVGDVVGEPLPSEPTAPSVSSPEDPAYAKTEGETAQPSGVEEEKRPPRNPVVPPSRGGSANTPPSSGGRVEQRPAQSQQPQQQPQRSTASGGGGSTQQSQPQSRQPSTSRLANTGAAVITIVLVALAMMIAGVALIAARHREND